MKKRWTKPVLVVLARGRPEEAILIACKGAPGNTGPSNVYALCMQEMVPVMCVECLMLMTS